jgi:hypothetical protein
MIDSRTVARRIQVIGWRPGPGQPPVSLPAEFLIAENWAEQGFLLDSFVAAGRPDEPSLALGGHPAIPFGPTDLHHAAKWGLRLRSDLPGAEVELLRKAFEEAADAWRRAHEMLNPARSHKAQAKAHPAGMHVAPPRPEGTPSRAASVPELGRKAPAPRAERSPHQATVLSSVAPPPINLTSDERRILDALTQRGILTRRQLAATVSSRAGDEASVEERVEAAVDSLSRKLNGPAGPVLERVPQRAQGPTWRLHRDRLPAWARAARPD